MRFKYLILVLLFLVLIPIASASWMRYQNDLGNRGFEPVMVSQWNETGVLTEIAEGANFQPLIFDADGDNNTEIIISSGNFLKVYEYDSNLLVLKDELNMGSAQDVMMTSTFDLDGNGFIEFVGVFNSKNITVFEFNSSNSLNIIRTNTISDYIFKTGITCLNHSGVLGCYAGAWNGTNSSVIEYNPLTNGIAYYHVSNNDVFSTTNGARISPPAADIDRDGFQEIVFIYDKDVDTYEGIAVWDVQAASLDTSFSGDGIVDDITFSTGGIMAGVLLSNVDSDETEFESCIGYCDETYPWYYGTIRDICFLSCYISEYLNDYGGGNTEIIISGYDIVSAGDTDSWLKSYRSDGSVMWSNKVVDVTTITYASNPVIQDVDGDGDWDICILSAMESTGTPNRNYFACVEDNTGTTLFSYYVTEGYPYWQPPATITIADMDSDGLYEIVTGNVYLNSDGSYVNITAFDGEYKTAHSVLSDINKDNILDVCGMKAGNMFCARSTYENVIPFLYGELGQNFISPICLDTTVTFHAWELGSPSSITHYSNEENGDRERLVSTCGINITIIEGDLSQVNPTLSCFYDTIGTYAFDIYLQDEWNTADYSQSQSFNIYVINGTSGVTCNLPISEETRTGGINVTAIPDEDLITTEADIEEAINIFTSQSDFMKGLLVLIFSLMAAFGMFKWKVSSPMIYAGTIFFLWIIFAMLGLLPWVYVFLFAVVFVGLGALFFVKGNGNG